MEVKISHASIVIRLVTTVPKEVLFIFVFNFSELKTPRDAGKWQVKRVQKNHSHQDTTFNEKE